MQSNYVRDKGLAMGANIPNIVSPITGEEEARPSLGYTFPMDKENLRRWRGWWKVANMEQGILFYGIGLLSLIALSSVLADSTLGVQPGLPADLEFIREEAQVLGNTVAPWFATFFLGAAAIKLFSTNIGILDWVSRLTAIPEGELARQEPVLEREQDLPDGRLEYDHHRDDHHPERNRAVDPPDHRRLGWRGRDGLLLDDAPRAQPPGAAGSHQAQELPPRDNSLFVRNVYRPLNLPALCGSHRADTVGRYRSCGSAAGVSSEHPGRANDTGSVDGKPLDRERRGKGKARAPETRLGVQESSRGLAFAARVSLAPPTSRRHASPTIFANRICVYSLNVLERLLGLLERLVYVLCQPQVLSRLI